jgi:hypothetical protein
MKTSLFTPNPVDPVKKSAPGRTQPQPVAVVIFSTTDGTGWAWIFILTVPTGLIRFYPVLSNA